MSPSRTNAGATHSRRWLLGSGAALAGSTALASCAIGQPDPRVQPVENGVPVARVDTTPTDPGSDEWFRTLPVDVEMDGQTMALPNRATPLCSSITVRAVHDGTTIGFRIDWPDERDNHETMAVDHYRDACAVLLADGDGNNDLRAMGTADQPTTLVHWKADWQYDCDEGRQVVADLAPNTAVDFYPPLVDTFDATVDDYAAQDASVWLPGMHVGNPLSAATRTSPVEKLVARGYGSAATAATQNATGTGARHDDGWRVLVARPLDGVDDGEVTLRPGGAYTCAFAVWGGASHDAGGRKSPSKTVLRLVLEA